MPFVVNPLTSKRASMWEARRSGLKLEDIGERFGVTRQAVCRALGFSDKKVEMAFRQLARTYKVLPERIDSRRGFLKGHSQVLESDVLFVYSPNHGIQLWYRHSERCHVCTMIDSCRDDVLAHASRLNIPLGKGEKSLPPARLAHLVFERAWPELKSNVEEG